MLAWLNQFDPLWFSLGPLLFINLFALSTVPAFALLRKKHPDLPTEETLEKRHHSRFLSRWFKEYWYWVTTPVEKLALALRLTPNFFTTFGVVLSLIAGIAFYYGRIGIGGWFVILGGTCDMFDGRIARKTHKTSASGAFYDSVMDRFGELVTLMGLAGLYRNHWAFWFVLASIAGSMMVSYNRARGQAVGVDPQGGIMQRPERIVYLGVGSIFSPIVAYLLHPFVKVDSDILLLLAIILIAVMTNLTALHRMLWVMRRLDKESH